MLADLEDYTPEDGMCIAERCDPASSEDIAKVACAIRELRSKFVGNELIRIIEYFIVLIDSRKYNLDIDGARRLYEIDSIAEKYGLDI